MPKLICISGPCGSGKTAFAEKLARRLVSQSGKTVYLLHGDDFHRGFIEPENKGGFFDGGVASDLLHWEDILRFNWGCILETVGRALAQGLDVLLDYVIEDELPLVRELSERSNAELYYIVLTADESELKRRIFERGDEDMAERAIFLKHKLESMPENLGHIFDNTKISPDEAARGIDLEDYRVR